MLISAHRGGDGREGKGKNVKICKLAVTEDMVDEREVGIYGCMTTRTALTDTFHRYGFGHTKYPLHGYSFANTAVLK